MSTCPTGATAVRASQQQRHAERGEADGAYGAEPEELESGAQSHRESAHAKDTGAGE